MDRMLFICSGSLKLNFESFTARGMTELFSFIASLSPIAIQLDIFSIVPNANAYNETIIDAGAAVERKEEDIILFNPNFPS